MNPFDSLLSSRIPMDEGASFFIGLKKLATTELEPDLTGTLEGRFAAPLPEVLLALLECIRLHMRRTYAYTVYSTSVRDVAQGAVHEMFEELSIEAREHTEYLTRRAAVLGGPVHAPDIEAPPPATDLFEIVRYLIRMEQDSIAAGQKLRSLVGENPLKFLVEQQLLEQQHGLDRLWSLLPHTADTPATVGTDPLLLADDGAPPEELPAGMAPPPVESAPAKLSMHPALRLCRVLGVKAASQLEDQLQEQEVSAAGVQAAPSDNYQDNSVQNWLQREQILRAHEEANASQFYTERFRNAMEQLKAIQEQQQATDQQMAALQQQAQQAQQSISAAQQQAQMVEDAAMQNLQIASQRTATALQQNQQLQDQLLAQQQLAIGERGKHQELRGTLMQLAQGAAPTSFAPPQVNLDPSQQQPGVPGADGGGAPGAPGGAAPPAGPTDVVPGAQGPQTQPAQAGGEAGQPPQGAQPTAQAKVSAAEQEQLGGTFRSMASNPVAQRLVGAAAGAGLGYHWGQQQGEKFKAQLPALRARAEELRGKRQEGTLTMREALESIRNATETTAGELHEADPSVVGRMMMIPSAVAGSRALPLMVRIGQHLKTIGS